jgi:hypothetical protein
LGNRTLLALLVLTGGNGDISNLSGGNMSHHEAELSNTNTGHRKILSTGISEVSDSAGHYDLDGVSYDPADGVIVASAPDKMKGLSQKPVDNHIKAVERI